MRLTDDEQKQLVDLLTKLEPGYYPIEIFWQFARLNVLPVMEVVPLRLSQSGEVEVLLLARPADDPHWPGQIHTPGTVIRPTDVDDPMMPVNRIKHEELNDTPVSDLYLVGDLINKSQRGVEHSLVYWVEVTGEPKTGQFYPAHDLPANLVDSQRGFIARAADQFLAVKTESK